MLLAGCSGPASPNVVIYLVDTLRADRLGCYGYDRPTTPRLDEFARESMLFQNVEAQSSWTKPAVASIFTGCHPVVHGANDWPDRLSDEHRTLAELLAMAGYETAAFVSSAVVVREFGFDRGFQTFEQVRKETIEPSGTTSSWVERQALDWLDRRSERPDAKPFLLYLHTLDPHAPYAPEERLRSLFAPEVTDTSIGTVDAINRLAATPPPGRARELSDLYDAEIRGNDESFGRLMAALEDAGRLDDTVVVFLSDHGEGFFEHGRLQHGNSLHAELVRVPLLIRFPDGRGAGLRVPEIAQQIDVLPTLLHFLELDVPAAIQGASLLPLLERSKPEWNRAALAHLEFEGRTWRSLRQADHRLLLRRRTAGAELERQLFDVAADPLEQRDLFATEPRLASRLESRFETAFAALTVAPPGVPARLDEEALRELRALGYLNGSGSPP